MVRGVPVSCWLSQALGSPPKGMDYAYTILGLTQHSSASNAYSPGRRRTAPTLSGVLATQDSRGFFVLASPSVEVTPPPIPQRAMDFAEGIRLQESFSSKAVTLQDFGPHGPTGFYPQA